MRSTIVPFEFICRLMNVNTLHRKNILYNSILFQKIDFIIYNVTFEKKGCISQNVNTQMLWSQKLFLIFLNFVVFLKHLGHKFNSVIENHIKYNEKFEENAYCLKRNYKNNVMYRRSLAKNIKWSSRRMHFWRNISIEMLILYRTVKYIKEEYFFFTKEHNWVQLPRLCNTCNV